MRLVCEHDTCVETRYSITTSSYIVKGNRRYVSIEKYIKRHRKAKLGAVRLSPSISTHTERSRVVVLQDSVHTLQATTKPQY